MDKLDVLINNRDKILLAEIGALIHDLGKLHKKFIEQHAKDFIGERDYDHGKILDEDSKREDELGRLARRLKDILENYKLESVHPDKEVNLHSIIKNHHLGDNRDISQSIFLKFIIAADRFDAEEDRGRAKDKQSLCATFKSTAFGYENEIDLGEFEELRKRVYKKLINILNTCNFEEIIGRRKKLLETLRTCFSKALGETQRSANDVTLWDHSYMTASIMKALVAYRILDPKFEVESRKEIEEKKPFQIFAIGWNFFEFIKQSHKIPDIVGRIKILEEEIKSKIKKIVEEKYALGNSIYEDDFGIYFLIPSILDENDLESVKKDIFEIFNEELGGILIPAFHIEKWEQDEKFRIGKLLTKAIKNLKEKVTSYEIELIEIPKWINTWRSGRNITLPKDKLICNVCGKGFYCRDDDEKICKTCKDIRKKGREHKLPQTVFIDEIAWNPEKKRYENVCLLIARFDLDEWLNGKYIRSLFIRNPEKFYNDLNWKEGKNISGLAGILGRALRNKIRSNQWDKEAKENVHREVKSFLYNKIIIAKGETIEKSIQKIISIIDQEISIGRSLKDIIDRESEDCFITKHCINFKYLDSLIILKPPSPSRLMRIWNNTKEFFENISKQICLITPEVHECKIILEGSIGNLIPNMAYTIEINGKEVGEVISLKKESDELFIVTPHTNDFLLENVNKIKNKKIILKHPDSRRVIAKSKIKDIKENGRIVRAYRIISISPIMFIAIIPANLSLNIVKMIKEEYEKCFGKVFGKLPLHIGLIFFKRMMPIFTVLDSANRMINEFENQKGEIRLSASSIKDDADCRIIKLTRYLFKTDKGEEYKTEYEIRIPYKLGDKKIDQYHSYLIVESDNDIIEMRIDDEVIVQKHPLKIKEGDVVKVKEYCFDFEFLDSNIRRFDIGKNRRYWIFTQSKNKPRPYLLWDIDNFERLRKLIKKLRLTPTQIMNLYEMLISKLEEWNIRGPPLELLYESDEKKKQKGKTFEKLVENAILDIPLRLEIIDGESSEGKISKKDFEFLKYSIMSGLFFDFVDLWHNILKKEFGGDEDVGR